MARRRLRVERYERYDFELVRKPENEGFSRTVNVGLERARDEGREAVLMNADIVMRTPGWLGALPQDDRLAGQAGGPRRRAAALPERADPARGPLLLEARATSSSTASASRPGNLPEAQVKTVCPVTGAFQYIRPEVLEQVGALRPGLPHGCEDVDYDLRVFQAGFECVYEPAIRAIHYESLFRSRPDEKVHAVAGDELRPPAAEVGGRADRRSSRPSCRCGRRRTSLFVGQTADASFYHRVMLPAPALGCDWCGLDSPPPRMTLGRGEVRFGARRARPRRLPHRRRADAVRTRAGSTLIRELQAGGTARPLRRRLLPATRSSADAEVLDAGRDVPRRSATACICATRARSRERYARLNPRTFVCENGIDLKAYALTRPAHDTVNIGWAGTSRAARGDAAVGWRRSRR